jgi:hypothetical protein
VSGSSGGLTGEGSHFPSSASAGTGEAVGSTIPISSTEDQGASRTGPAAASSAGPEHGGSTHIGTVAPSEQPKGAAAAASQIAASTTSPTSHRTEGTVGQTGVPPHAAEAAAHKALTGTALGGKFSRHSYTLPDNSTEGMPGAYPSDNYVNPYKAENLDPRVDNLPIRSKENKSTGTAATGSAAGLAAATATGSLAAHDTSRQATAPSSLTSTVNPADRSAEYKQAEATQVPAPQSTETSTQAENQQPSSFVGKALAAVGLGGVAGVAAGTLAGKDDDSSAVPDTTVADSTPAARHSRKESIPTTAYPAGVDSPRPINPPIGGTGQTSEASRQDSDHHYGRDTALGAAGVGAAGLSAHEATTKSKVGPDNTSGLRDDLVTQPSGISDQAQSRATSGQQAAPSGVAPAAAGGTGAAAGTYIIGGDRNQSPYDPEQQGRTGERLKEPVTSSPAAVGTPTTATPEKDDHTARNAALAAGGATAVGAGAYAATRSDQQSYGHTAIYGPGEPSTTSQAATTGVATQPAVSQTPTAGTEKDQDHTKRNAALAGAGVAGLGAGAYAAHEHSDKIAGEEAARQQAAVEKERAAAEKAQHDLDKSHKKDLEKQEKAAAKDEKKHQKEVEKLEKKQQKEAEKQAKKDEKEAALLDKQRTKEEEERQRREEEEERKRAAAAGAAVGVGAAAAGAAGTGAYAYDKNDKDASVASPKSEEKQKKPGLFKRIFKRRKNKDTGESEEYSSEEEDKDKDDSRKGTALAGTAAVGVGAGAAYAAHEHEDTAASRTGTHESQSRYEAVSGGAVKPSYVSLDFLPRPY